MTDAGNISEQETSSRPSPTPTPSPTLPPRQERSEELRDSEPTGESSEQQDTTYTFPGVDQQQYSPEQQRCTNIRKHCCGVVCHRTYPHNSLVELHTNARRYKKLSRFCLFFGLAIAAFYAGAGGIYLNNILTEDQREENSALLLAVWIVGTTMAIVCVSYWCHSYGYEAWFNPRADSLSAEAVRFSRQYDEQVASRRASRSNSSAGRPTADPPV